MRIEFISLLLILVTLPGNTAEQPLIVITGPTVIAFFPPINNEMLAKDFDTNTTLDDFQFYASKAREPLKKAFVDFQEVYAHSFRVRDGKKQIIFQPKNTNIGYYFISPGMESVVEDCDSAIAKDIDIVLHGPWTGLQPQDPFG